MPQGVAQQLVDVFDREWAENDLIQPRTGPAQGLQLEHQRMGRVDLIVAICADQQQVPCVGMEEEIFDERQRGRIEPLQVIDEDDERVFRPRKHADESLEHGLKPQFGIDGREDRYGRLWSYQSSEVWNEVGQQTALIADSFLDRVSPAGNVVRLAVHQLLNQSLKRLSQCRVGRIPEAQIEFSRNEDAARQHDDLVQLVDYRRLADARVARDQNELRAAMHHDAVEGGKQGGDLALASVELLRDHQPLRRVLQTKRERLDPADRLPGGEALAEIRLDSRGGLVALLGGLLEKLHDDHRKWGRHRPCKLAQRDGLSRDVTVDQLDRVNCGEGQRAGQQLVKGGPQRVQVASRVDRAVHPAGLFGRHVGERARDHLWRGGGLALARQTRSDAEPRQPHAAACRFHQDICRLDVLMDEATLMHMAERARERDRDAQEMRYVQWPAKQSIERRTAGILKHQRHTAVIVRKRDGSRRPVGVKFGLEGVFVFKLLDATGRSFFCGNKQDRRQAVARAPV